MRDLCRFRNQDAARTTTATPSCQVRFGALINDKGNFLSGLANVFLNDGVAKLQVCQRHGTTRKPRDGSDTDHRQPFPKGLISTFAYLESERQQRLGNDIHHPDTSNDNGEVKHEKFATKSGEAALYCRSPTRSRAEPMRQRRSWRRAAAGQGVRHGWVRIRHAERRGVERSPRLAQEGLRAGTDACVPLHGDEGVELSLVAWFEIVLAVFTDPKGVRFPRSLIETEGSEKRRPKRNVDQTVDQKRAKAEEEEENKGLHDLVSPELTLELVVLPDRKSMSHPVCQRTLAVQGIRPAWVVRW